MLTVREFFLNKFFIQNLHQLLMTICCFSFFSRCDDLLHRLPSGQLTVLVFCEGEQLNLFRVVENVDGTYSPIGDSVNPSSIRYISCLVFLRFLFFVFSGNFANS